MPLPGFLRAPLSFGRTKRQLIAAIATDGDACRLVVVNGPGGPEENKLRDLRRWEAADLEYLVTNARQSFAASDKQAEMTAVTLVAGDDLAHVVRRLDELGPDFSEASDAQREAAIMRSTAWAAEDTRRELGLTVGVAPDEPGSINYVVAAAATEDVRAARSRVPLDRVHAFTPPSALDALIRELYPGLLSDPAPLLGLLCNESYIAATLIEQRRTRVLYYVPVADVLAKLGERQQKVEAEATADSTPFHYARSHEEPDARDAEIIDADEGVPRAAGASATGTSADATPPADRPAASQFTERKRPEDYDVGYAGSSSFRRPAAVPPPEPVTLDAATYEASIRYAIGRVNELYTTSDFGEAAFSTDIERVLVTGAAVDTFKALHAVKAYYGSAAIVEPLTAYRVTYTDDNRALAEEVRDFHHTYGDTFALLAAARRQQTLELLPDAIHAWETAGDPVYPGASGTPRGRARLADVSVHPLIATLVVFLLVVGVYPLARGFYLARQRARVAAELEVEQKRNQQLAEDTKKREQEEARIRETRENSKAVADARAEQQEHKLLDAALRDVYMNPARNFTAHLRERHVDEKGFVRLVGQVPTTDDAERLIRALATYGNGQFVDSDLKTEVKEVETLVTPEGAEVAAPPDDPAALAELKTGKVPKVLYTITTRFVGTAK